MFVFLSEMEIGPCRAVERFQLDNACKRLNVILGIVRVLFNDCGAINCP